MVNNLMLSNRNVQQRQPHEMTILSTNSTATATRKASFKGELSPFALLCLSRARRIGSTRAWSAWFLLRRGMSSDEEPARGVHVVVLQHRCRRRRRRGPWSSVVAARLAIVLIGAGATTADGLCGHAHVHARIHSQVARMVRFLCLHLQFPVLVFFRTPEARCRAVESGLFLQCRRANLLRGRWPRVFSSFHHPSVHPFTLSLTFL